MKLEILKCPSCGANIEFEEGAEYCECEYCGAKVKVSQSSEKPDTATEVFKKFSSQTYKSSEVKSKNTNPTEEGAITKFKKLTFNIFFAFGILFAGITTISAIADADVGMVFFTLFILCYTIMFRVLALTPKGSKYILGKKRGLRPIYFVLICILMSFMIIALSPDSGDSANTDSGTNEKPVVSQQVSE